MRDKIQQTGAEQYGEESKDRNEVIVDFVRTEVDLAETFCALAANAISPQKAERNRDQVFERAADLDAEMISVEAKDGKVLLRGTVDSWAERERAELAARAAPGVSRVENEILVASDQNVVAAL